MKTLNNKKNQERRWRRDAPTSLMTRVMEMETTPEGVVAVVSLSPLKGSPLAESGRRAISANQRPRKRSTHQSTGRDAIFFPFVFCNQQKNSEKWKKKR